MVAFVFVRQNQLKTTHSVIIFSLCVGGILSSMTGTLIVTVASFIKKWIFGDLMCIIYGFLMTALGVFNIMILTIAAVDRYVTIVKTEWKTNFTKPVSVILVFISAVYSIVWAFFPVFGWNEYTLEAMETACAITWESSDPNNLSFCMALFSVAFVIPIVIISASYISIYSKIRKQRNPLLNRVTRITENMEQKIAYTTFLMIIGFVVAWGPYASFSLWSTFAGPENISPQLAAIPAVIAKMSVFWNTLIYLYTNKQFQKAFRKEFPRLGEIFSNKISPADVTIQCESGVVLHKAGLTARGPTLGESVMTTVSLTPGIYNPIKLSDPPKSKATSESVS
ncbi:hypothetical protein KUTeg_023122 [Tegillarca granosa]|uniref:G-protein coupled receptors family 1 profile domain-containing protein n=1 Tax=Tegillarca granosa TaxID=220873 RepID=A0ABQ9E1C2_TEGGR|nr:hypothetical protein KUTeg_023122 [Tegillarca granosa]